MYIFYDTEATGLDLHFSQLLQVALVFTDDNLNILASKKVECRRSPWVVPSPGAMLITGFKPDDLKNNPLSHYDMMKDITDWVKTQHWPLTFVGYNSLSYDEPLLARNLAHNLQSPDLTTAVSPQNAAQRNTRLDVFTMVKLVALYRPCLLKLETLNEYGKPSMSLLNVAKQNGVALSDDEAHDAMNDIKATIGVARIIKDGAPDLWDHFAKMSSPENVAAYAAKTPIFAYTDLAYGRNKTMVVTDAGAIDGGNTRIVFDLTRDPAKYANATVEELVGVMRRAFDRNNTEPVPFRLVSATTQPSFMPVDTAGALLNANMDKAEMEKRAAALKVADPAFLARVAEAAALVQNPPKRKFNQKAESPLLEQLFDRPLAPRLKARLQNWCERFHKAPNWPARAQVLDAFYAEFDPDIKKDATVARFAKYAGRILFENAPETLTEEQRKGMRAYVARRLLNPDLSAPYMTISKARKELETIEKERATGKGRWKDVSDSDIRTIKLYYTALEKDLQGVLVSAPSPAPKPPQP